MCSPLHRLPPELRNSIHEQIIAHETIDIGRIHRPLGDHSFALTGKQAHQDFGSMWKVDSNKLNLTAEVYDFNFSPLLRQMDAIHHEHRSQKARTLKITLTLREPNILSGMIHLSDWVNNATGPEHNKMVRANQLYVLQYKVSNEIINNVDLAKVPTAIIAAARIRTERQHGVDVGVHAMLVVLGAVDKAVCDTSI